MQVISKAQLKGAGKLLIAADVNAVPPAGIEGLAVQRQWRSARSDKGGRHRPAGHRQCQIQGRVRPLQTNDRG